MVLKSITKETTKYKKNLSFSNAEIYHNFFWGGEGAGG